MAVNGEFNALGQMRIDVPHLRLLESGVRYDFDALGYSLVSETPQIVKGFELLSNPVGLDANLLTFKVAGSKIIHPLASESGSFFSVPSDRANEVVDPNVNSRVLTSIQPNSTNYIGFDLRRTADPTTADVSMFLDPNLNKESGQKVPLRRTIDYVWSVSQTDFSFNRSICPVAIVTTNAQNSITSFQDARPLMGRLTPGGSASTEINPYGWPGGRPDVTLTSPNSIVGDKAIRSLKEWQNAVMTRLWEIGGGQQWFSPTADRNVNMHTGASVFTSTGESFEVVASNLHWQGVSFSFDNSPQYNLVVSDQTADAFGLTDLASGECIYVDIDRTIAGPISAQKGQLTTLGLGAKPGSRFVIAVRINSNYYVNGVPWPIGSSFNLATTAHTGVIKTNIDFSTPNPIAATVVPTGFATGIVTGKGLSNNRDQGTLRLFDTDSDLTIGRGTAAGDQNVIIKTEGNFGTIIVGSGDKSHPHIATKTGGGLPYGSPSADATHLDLDGLIKFEGTASWSHNSVNVLPLAPSSGATSIPQIKYFPLQNKTWKTSVRCAQIDPNGVTAGSWSYDNTTKILTLTSTTAVLNVDGIVVAANDRVLISIGTTGFNGIYQVVNPGGVTNATLVRTIDSGGPGSSYALGLGFDLWAGSAVKITSGISYTGTYWVVSLPNLKPVALDGTQVFTFTQTDNQTSDQMATMWWDGSFTIVASGPSYPVA